MALPCVSLVVEPSALAFDPLATSVSERHGLDLRSRILRRLAPRTSVQRQQRRSTCAVLARAPVQASSPGAVLSGVDELPDGSLILHYDQQQHEAEAAHGVHYDNSQLVAFLTRPVNGHRRRRVPRDVLQQLLGEDTTAGGIDPVKGLASLVKGVLAPQKDSGAPTTTKAVAAAKAVKSGTESHVAVGPAPAAPAAPAAPPAVAPEVPAVAAATGAQAATAPPSATAPPQPSSPVATPVLTGPVPEKEEPLPQKSPVVQPPSAPSQASPVTPRAVGGGGLDLVRVTAVVVSAAITTALLRGAGIVLGVGRAVSPLVASVGLFVFSSVLLWFTGFAQDGKATAVKVAS